jgi:ParB family chromosome partitioning protein
MNSFYFWDEMAAKCLKSERYQEAIQSYRHALEATDDNASQASVWANIGNIFLTIQDIPAAVDAFLSASRLDPTSYDFDCILERITANGYLDEKAMLMAKDMYTLESVKTAQESEAVLEESLDEVFAAEPEQPETISEPVVDEPATVVDAEPVEPISSNEVNQPVAEAVSVEETPDEAEAIISVAEIAPTLEPVFEETEQTTEGTECITDDPAGERGAGTEPELVKLYMLIPVTEIVENPLHLRVEMKSDELVESVRQFGILQPLVVTRMDDGKYMVVTGNRRLEAARLAGLEYVPAVVRTATEREFLELALIENIQRVNLDPLELAEAYHLLIENFGLSADLIAASIGKNASVVMAAIDLLKLTEEGKQALQERSISEGHARALVEIDLPALQNNALVYVLENRLGVRQTEDLVRIILNAVAVSRSYDESYHNVAVVEPAKEPEPIETAVEAAAEAAESETVAEASTEEAPTETKVVAEISESEPVAEPEVVQAEALEPVVAETLTEEAPALETNAIAETTEIESVVVAEAPAEPEVVQAVAEEPAPVAEQENIETPVAVEAVPAVEQSAPVMVTDDQLMDMLVAECEQAEIHVEENATAEDASVDFSWLEPAAAEVEAQIPAEEIHAPASIEFSVDELLEKTTSVVASTESVAAVNGDVAQPVAVQTDVAVAAEPVVEKVEENLADVIEEIVQFTPTGDQAPTEEPAEPAPAEVEPAVSKEAEEAEPRAPLKGLEAIAVYRRVVENNPTNVRIWHLLGNLYSDMGQYEEAIDCMKRTVELDPGKYTYFYHLGLTLAIARRYPEAIDALEKTVELAPQHILAHCSLAGCYRRTGNSAETEKHLEIARPKLDQEKAYNRACFASISGNVDQAIELLQIALDTDKTPPEWLLRDPDLDFIRDDPRFEAMIAWLGIPMREA